MTHRPSAALLFVGGLLARGMSLLPTHVLMLVAVTLVAVGPGGFG